VLISILGPRSFSRSSNDFPRLLLMPLDMVLEFRRKKRTA
jgi:hypothetical protein